MNNVKKENSLEVFLAHYGIKGMKWGVHRSNPQATGPEKIEIRSVPGRHIQTRGGARRPASKDAIRTAKLKRTARSSTTDSLSNRELQELVQRMNLEQQYDRLRPRSTSEKLTKFLSDTLLGVAKDQAGNYVRDYAKNSIKKS